MKLSDILTEERIAILPGHGGVALSKVAVVKQLATLLASGSSLSLATIEETLLEREQLQSTGIGEGVAIPHASLPGLDTQRAALVLARHGVQFDAIDHQPVSILFAVVGPKHATGEHLKTLARISRVLRNQTFRDELLDCDTVHAAFERLIREDNP